MPPTSIFSSKQPFRRAGWICLLECGQRLVDLVGMRQHRDQQLDRAVLRGAQDGAQLRLEHPRLGQRQADGAQPSAGLVFTRSPMAAVRVESLSLPRSKVRMVTGRPPMPLTTFL
jgi:hypothetical protein